LADTQCFADTPETKEKRNKAIEMIKNGELEKYADDSVRNLFAQGSLIEKCMEVAAVRKMILTTSDTSLCKTLIALAERKETCTILNAIKVPVLLMVGAEDKITPPTAAKYLNENINSSSLQIIEHAGHLSNMENATKFNEHLLNFLSTVG
jgi:homoserine acetyltransferase